MGKNTSNLCHSKLSWLKYMQCYLVLHRCFSRRGFWEDLCYAVVSHRTNRYRRFRESLAFHTHALLARTTTKERERESASDTDPFCSVFSSLSGSTLLIFRSEQMHFGADRLVNI